MQVIKVHAVKDFVAFNRYIDFWCKGQDWSSSSRLLKIRFLHFTVMTFCLQSVIAYTPSSCSCSRRSFPVSLQTKKEPLKHLYYCNLSFIIALSETCTSYLTKVALQFVDLHIVTRTTAPPHHFNLSLNRTRCKWGTCFLYSTVPRLLVASNFFWLARTNWSQTDLLWSALCFFWQLLFSFAPSPTLPCLFIINAMWLDWADMTQL